VIEDGDRGRQRRGRRWEGPAAAATVCRVYEFVTTIVLPALSDVEVVTQKR